MIISEANIEVHKSNGKVMFSCPEHPISDQECVTVVYGKGDAGMGTMDFYEDRVILHPPNGKDSSISPEAFIDWAAGDNRDWPLA